MAVDENKKTRVLVNFPNEMLELIDKYWHENHIKNRNEAIRELVQKGLDS